jgi:5-methylcytosine-specific restriction enzyme B
MEIDLKTHYEGPFQTLLKGEWAAWRRSYLDSVRYVQDATEEVWKKPEFQSYLWEDDSITTLGPGNAVTVPGAYDDAEVSEALWQARIMPLPESEAQRAAVICLAYEDVIGLVSPKHSERKPWARLARMFAAIFPNDMLCLVGGDRTNRLRRYLGIPKGGREFVAQHPLIRERFRSALGPEIGLEANVEYAMLGWFLIDRVIDAADIDEGATVLESTETAGSRETPKLHIRPWQVQRKGMFMVTDNIAFLRSLVQASEHGAPKDELVQLIVDEAQNLSSKSASNVVNQTKFFGLLALEGGVYRPTEEGLALLEGDPIDTVLAPVFVRKVLGFALMLHELRASGGTLPAAELFARLQGHYPKWTTTFPLVMPLERWYDPVLLLPKDKV